MLSRYCDMFRYTYSTVTKHQSGYEYTKFYYQITYYKMIGDFQTPEYVTALIRDDGLFFCFSSAYMDLFPDKVDLHGLTLAAIEDEITLLVEDILATHKGLTDYQIKYNNHLVILEGEKYAIECSIDFFSDMGEVLVSYCTSPDKLYFVLVE